MWKTIDQKDMSRTLVRKTFLSPIKRENPKSEENREDLQGVKTEFQLKHKTQTYLLSGLEKIHFPIC